MTGSISKLTWSMFPPGPWECERCGRVMAARGTMADQAQIHHRNHDRSDNRRENLEMLCRACHTRHHRAGRPGNRRGAKMTDEQRQRMSERAAGKPLAHGYTLEVRARISASKTGRPHLEKKLTCSCGKQTTAGPMKRHTNSTGHTTDA